MKRLEFIIKAAATSAAITLPITVLTVDPVATVTTIHIRACDPQRGAEFILNHARRIGDIVAQELKRGRNGPA